MKIRCVVLRLPSAARKDLAPFIVPDCRWRCNVFPEYSRGVSRNIRNLIAISFGEVTRRTNFELAMERELSVSIERQRKTTEENNRPSILE